MPLMYPSKSARKRTPSSVPAASPLSIWLGFVVGLQSVQGQSGGLTATTDAVAPADSMFPLSSIARVSRVNVLRAGGRQAYVLLSRPVTGCHVVAPSVDISTPPTTPPPRSVEVPVTLTTLPPATVVPSVGQVIVEIGGMESVEAVAATRPDCSVVGCTPMSARRFTVA